MEDNSSIKEQNHPLYSTDRDHIDRLLATSSPSERDFIDLARLFLRYEGFPGALDLQHDMEKILNIWGISRQDLNSRTKKLWENGYRPGREHEDNVGSGFDTSDSNEG